MKTLRVSWERGRALLITPARALAYAGLAAATVCLAACGSGHRHAPRPTVAGNYASPACQQAVTRALGDVATRVYRQLLHGQRLLFAAHSLERSGPLIDAVSRGDANAAGALSASFSAGVTRLQILRGSQPLVAHGRAPALAPVHGALRDRTGRVVGRFDLSALSQSNYAQLAAHLTASRVVLDVGGRQTVSAGAANAASGASQVSFDGEAFPTGRVRVTLLVPRAQASVCGASDAEATANAIGAVGQRLYAGEAAGPAVQAAIGRIATDPPLRRAVARGDAAATRSAIVALLSNHQHIVRIRVIRAGRLVSDVGGPFVLAPVAGTLRDARGTPIGEFVTAVQDDLGYRLLMRRFTGTHVLLRVGGRVIMGGIPGFAGTIPETGSTTIHGARYQLFSFTGTAFPSGPLKITLMMRRAA